jgi:hypothetical protein
VPGGDIRSYSNGPEIWHIAIPVVRAVHSIMSEPKDEVIEYVFGFVP